jgi:hypothetical protein
MSDIVERLCRTLSDLPGNDDDLFNEIHAQRDEAAEEIKRLRTREARLREALEKIIHEDLWTTKHPDGVTQRGESVFDGYFGGIARAALEGKDKK